MSDLECETFQGPKRHTCFSLLSPHLWLLCILSLRYLGFFMFTHGVHTYCKFSHNPGVAENRKSLNESYWIRGYVIFPSYCVWGEQIGQIGFSQSFFCALFLTTYFKLTSLAQKAPLPGVLSACLPIDNGLLMTM